jgi:hypothetical protein
VFGGSDDRDVHAGGDLVCRVMAMAVNLRSQSVTVVGDGQCAGVATDVVAVFGVLPEMKWPSVMTSGDIEAPVRGRACGGFGEPVGF